MYMYLCVRIKLDNIIFYYLINITYKLKIKLIKILHMIIRSMYFLYKYYDITKYNESVRYKY